MPEVKATIDLLDWTKSGPRYTAHVWLGTSAPHFVGTRVECERFILRTASAHKVEPVILHT